MTKVWLTVYEHSLTGKERPYFKEVGFSHTPAVGDTFEVGEGWNRYIVSRGWLADGSMEIELQPFIWLPNEVEQATRRHIPLDWWRYPSPWLESEEADEPLAEVLQRCGWTKGAGR